MNKVNIALVSDSHGNKEFIHKFLDRVSEQSIHLVMHLGDYYQDALPVQEKGIALIRVPGTWTPYYQDPMIDNRRFETFLDWRLFLTHTPEIDNNDRPEDIDPQTVIDQKLADIFLHGHTHTPSVSKKNGVIVINPGHIKQKIDRGKPASFGILSLAKEKADMSIYTLFTGEVLIKESFNKCV